MNAALWLILKNRVYQKPFKKRIYKMRNIKSILTVMLLLMASIASGQVANKAAGPDIVTHLNNETRGQVTVTMPAQLKERLKPENGNAENGMPTKSLKSNVGYRIQAYSGSGTHSRQEAQGRMSRISAKYPYLRSNIVYKAPSWRLRVGDYRTRQEAKDALEEMKDAFPSYAKELTIVVDRIHVDNE